MRLPLIASSRFVDAVVTSASAPRHAGWSVVDAARSGVVGQVVADRVRQDEVAVGQALHQRAGAEPVGAVVGEVRLADHEQARGSSTAGRSRPTARPSCSDGRVDPHRHLVRVLAGDPLVHLEQVAVLAPRSVGAAQPLDGVARSRGRRRARRGPTPRPSSQTSLAAREAMSRGDQVAEARVACAPGSSRARPPGSGSGGRVSPCLLRHPDAAVVAQRLGHQRQLRLVVAGDRDAGRVDLGEAGVGEQRAAACARARSR